MSNILMIAPVILWGGVNLFFVRLFKKGFGSCLPFTFIFSIIITYYSQVVFGTFSIGVWTIIVLGIAGIVWAILDRDRIKNINGSVGYGLFAFLFISFLFIIVDYKRHFACWDEYSHWGMMVKELFRLDDFYCADQARFLAHKDYPPFAPLFEYLWCRLSGGFSEAKSAMAINIFSAVMVVPPTIDMLIKHRRVDKNSKIYGFVITIVISVSSILMIGTFDVYGTYGSIMADYLISLIFVWCLILIYEGREKAKLLDTGNMIFLIAGLTALLMIKEVGIAFCLVVIFALVLSFIGQDNVEIKVRKYITQVVLIIVIPSLTYISWNARIKGMNYTGQFSLGEISISSIINILFGNGTEVQNITTKAYVNAIIDTNLYSGLFNIRFATSILIALAIIWVLHLKYSQRMPKRRAIELSAVCICGTIGYAFLMFVLYMYCFSPDESVVLASYQRYMSTYLIGEFLFLSYIALECIYENNKGLSTKRELIIWGCVVILLFDWHSARYIKPDWNDYNSKYRNDANWIADNAEDWSTILTVGDESVLKSHVVNFYTDNLYVKKDEAIVEELSMEDCKKKFYVELANVDYIYCMEPNSEVKEVMAEWCGSEEVADGVLFAVDRNDENTRLKVKNVNNR